MSLVIIKLLKYTYSIGIAVTPYTVNIDLYVSRICVVHKFKSLHVKLQNCDKIIKNHITQVIIIASNLYVRN